MTRGRNGIEQAVSSLEFLQRCGLQFLGADTERVLAIVRRIDPAVALHPEDGLDAEEQQFLLSNLLPFFGVEMSAGATLADMMTILDTMNHGTSERRSGLLSHLVETRVGYIDPDSLRFRIDRFETAFWAAR
ncbi:MAG TPA: hypothetical protein PK765_00050 [bacterium]|nr:hypothetical protein [bacterium]